MERSDKPLLDWLLLKHADTPKSRAKQWIMAGRVSVRGKVIRKPHEKIGDPGNTLSRNEIEDKAVRTAGKFIRAFRCFIWMLPWRSSAKGPA